MALIYTLRSLCVCVGVRVCALAELTLLLFGVQLRHADGETVHALLKGVDPEREGVGLIEELSEQVLRIFTCTHTHSWRVLSTTSISR